MLYRTEALIPNMYCTRTKVIVDIIYRYVKVTKLLVNLNKILVIYNKM